MSNIKIFGLGGLGESGKNLYVIEVEEQIFILEAGTKNPLIEMYGVDAIIPDISYLINNKHRIQGIFLSHGHDDKIGAVPIILKSIRTNIYGSRFTMSILKDSFIESEINYYKKNLKIIDENTELKFKDVMITFFRTTHSIPESLGIAIHTKDGVIVYTGDYSFNTHVKKSYKTSFDKISALKGKGVLALLSDSVGCTYQSTGDSNYLLEHSLTEAFRKNTRLLISAFSNELDKIQMAIDIAIKFDRKIAIIGRKAQRIIDISVNLGYLKIPKDKLVTLKFIDNRNNNYSDDMVVLVTGDKHEPYYMLQRIARKRDKLVHINSKDTVVVMTIPVPGVEKMAANTIDLLYKSGADVRTIDRKLLRGSHASVHDTKLMYNLLKPKYIIPVLGEYRHQYAQVSAAKSYGYSDDFIILLDNGDVVTFKDGERIKKLGTVQADEVLIDGALIGDINEVVLKDRENLARDGVLMVIGNIDARKKKIVTDPEIVSQGFMLEKENPQLFEEIKNIYLDIAKESFLNKYIDWQDLKFSLRDKISKYISKQTNRRTIVIPVLIDTVT
ncbi:ribonuclease J [Mycoplasmatota bacterium]|nr:ribonuclease J [Mycoplasmatota bacterium]